MKTQSVLVAITHEILNAETFEELGDLAEAVKHKCARLRIPYDGGRVSDALHVVARTRPLLAVPPPRPGRPVEPDLAEPLISAAEAHEILLRITRHLKRGAA